MSSYNQLHKQLTTIFAPLNTMAASTALPPRSSLSKSLEKIINRTPPRTSNVDLEVAKYFATGAVEVWHRAVHSFLISASLSEASPIWASVSGYYSSHYSIRAFAHLLGYFHLFKRKLIVRLEIHNGRFVCAFDKKKGEDREHRFYWKIVKDHSHFREDPLFSDNVAVSDVSDVGHRNLANYVDHLGRYPNFQALDVNYLKRRIQFISRIQFDMPPIPRLDNFPDVDNVQVVAYHRIVKFRDFLDQTLGSSNRFWSVYRNPPWASGMTDFQLTKSGNLEILRN